MRGTMEILSLRNFTVPSLLVSPRFSGRSCYNCLAVLMLLCVFTRQADAMPYLDKSWKVSTGLNVTKRASVDAILQPYRTLLVPLMNQEKNKILSNKTNTFHEKYFCQKCICIRIHETINQADCSRSNLSLIPDTLPEDISSLSMARNRLKVFKSTDISVYQKMENLDLQYNQILTIELTTMIPGLVSFNLGRNNISDLKGINCIHSPGLRILKLDRNNIKCIPSNAFKGCKKLEHLDLSYNKIKQIDVLSFDSLYNLNLLYLRNNTEMGYTFTPNLFRKLRKLQRLQIQGCSNGSKQYPDKALGSLQKLTELSIDGIGAGIEFGPDMQNLTHLKTIRFFCGTHSACQIQNISSNFFENIPHVKSLVFKACPFKHVDPRAFQYVQGLTRYRISGPIENCTLKDAFRHLKGLQNTNLTHLALTGFRSYDTLCQTLSPQEGYYVQNLSLIEFDLSRNYLTKLDKDFLLMLPKTMQIFTLNNNRFTAWNRNISCLPSLKKLNISNQNVEGSDVIDVNNYSKTKISYVTISRNVRRANRQIGFSEDQDQDKTWGPTMRESSVPDMDATSMNYDLYSTFSNDVEDSQEVLSEQTENPLLSRPIELPPNLASIASSRFLFFGSVCLFYNITITSLRRIEFSESFLTTWGRGRLPTSIEYADLSKNYCDYIQPHFIPVNNSLKSLIIAENYLGIYLSKDLHGDTFANAKKLRRLDITNNDIFNLSRLFLRGLVSLEILILTENKLHSIDLDFSFTPNLRFLDLSKNSINWISDISRHSLEKITRGQQLKIDLTYNLLSCTCSGITLLKWISANTVIMHNKDFLACYDSNKEMHPLRDISAKVTKIEAQCSSTLLMTVSASLGAMILIFISIALLYKNRWKLIYARNVWLIKMYGFQPMGRTASGCKYDVYVVYCTNDQNFVLDVLLVELEEKRGHRVCVEDRDFLPGSFNFNNVTCAILNSTITLLVISPDFLRERELEYAIQMALVEEYSSQNRHDVLLMLNYKRTSDGQMSKDLLMLMKKGRFLDYPREGEEGQSEVAESTAQAFWDRLSREIGHTTRQH